MGRLARGQFFPAGAAVWAVCIAAVAPAQLQLEPPEIPARFHTDRLVELEQQIERLDRQIEGADRPRQLTLTAGRSLRTIARQLWLTGRAAGDNGSLAIVYAMTIQSSAEAFDRLIEPLPRQAAEAIAAPDQPDRLKQLRRAIDALKAFNEVAGEEPASASAAHIDAYLRTTLSPLAVVVEVMGGGEPVSTWVDAAMDAPPPRLSATRITALQGRIADAPLAEATRGEMRWLTEMMLRAVDEADLRPRVMNFYLTLSRLVDAAEAFSRANWLDELTRRQFQSQAHTAVLLFKDAKTRRVAEARFARMNRMRGLLAGMNRLAAHDDVEIDPLRQTFITAYRLLGHESSAETAGRLVDLLSRIVAAALAQRTLDPPEQLPLDVRRSQQVLARRYAALERQVIARLPALLADPSQVTQPKWTQPVDQMQAVARDVRHLGRVPEWVERMARFNPAAARGLYKQLRLIADDLLNPTTHAGASAALVELERQLSLFETLPHEPMLREEQSVIGTAAGPYLPDIRKQVTVLRSQWAAAWAAGSDPTPAGRNLLRLRRLMVALHDGGRFLADDGDLALLNRWAAVQAPAEAIAPLRQWLPAELEAAAGQAAAGEWTALGATLDRIDQQTPAIWLLVRLTDRLAPAMRQVPDGAAGLLSRTLYPPPDGALGASHRLDLARLSVALTAAASERTVGTPTTVAPLMEYAGDLARQLLRWLEGRPTSDRPPGADVESIDV